MMGYNFVIWYSTNATQDKSLTGPVEKLLNAVVIIEIVLMSILLLFSLSFLINSCRQKQKTARFITKLLLLITCVAVCGLADAIHEAPWLQDRSFYNSSADIIITAVFDFLFWVAAQWSTWIIAFQFYSTAQQMKKVDKHF